MSCNFIGDGAENYIYKLRFEEIGVMDVAQVSVTTRKRVLPTEVVDESSGTAEREKESEFSSLVQFKRHRQVTENSVSPQCLADDQCWSPNSDDIAASYCSSTELLKFPDLEEESVEIEKLTYERRETTPLSELGEMESKAKPPAANSRRQSMPSQAQLEEFFSVAEKDIQRKFTEKYNFDIVKDKPLKGRYEWVPLKP